ncbi:plakophilin-2 [Platichthys flesus]|uniref:plakophilin-2 n=1 Tax=Platichthys flesus TaxID=8260 RepID=UPI002DBEB1A3|nr:plakophilin-2 [Platichthys flesus]
MDEVFLRSAPHGPGRSGLDDTSLALPAGPAAERSLRVQQQVQLTLARRARRSQSNGGVHLQRSAAQSFDAADGHLPNNKMNGLTSTSCSLYSNHVRRPTRRVEVSPPQTPRLPRAPFSYSTLRFGTYTFPGPGQPQRTGTPHHRSYGNDSPWRYAFSEAPHGTRPHTSTTASRSFRQGLQRQMSGPQPGFANAAFQQSAGYGPRWSQNRTERHNVQERGGDEGLSWLAQGGRNAQPLRRLNSYPPTVTSVEVDMGRKQEVDVPVQQIQTQNVMALKSENKPPEMTLDKAVGLLTQENEETLIYAASHIQNQCFKSAEAKKMVYFLRGIGKLLQLLHSDSEEVQRVAAGSLRNVVYQSSENKMEVKESDGIATILGALKSSRDLETRRQLAGLLWNLSSHDLLKERLSRQALSVLTQSVLVPSSGISEGENPKDELLADSEVFHLATGCLRNLSSAGPDGRKAMRHCENLIDSLVYYIRGTIADYKTDDKSTENCVCILHNLSYQMEAELPKEFPPDLSGSRRNLAPEPKSVSCFPQRSAKITENLERQCPLLEEKANPRGMEWLWSAITVRMYLSLIARSVRPATQEAAVGALQNITAGSGAVSEAIAFTVVQRENGLHHVKNMLQEKESDVKRTTVSLIKNLSQHHELHPDIVKQVLPEVVAMLPNDDTGTDLPTEVTASLCHILINLCQSNLQHVRAIVHQGALPKIINVSSRDSGYGPNRAAQAACTLLHTMWKYTDLHGAYKKCGYRKTDFINPRTTKAVSSGRT